MSEQEKPKTKLAKNLMPGDKVKTESGLVVTITKISKGFYNNSVFITWKDGWSNPMNDDEIEVK